MAALRDVVAGFKGESDAELAAVLLRRALDHLNELGDSAQQAIVIGEPLIADQERILSPDYPGTLNSRSDLAAYREAGRAD